MKFSVFSLFRASAIFCFLAALGAAQQTTVLYDASTYEQKRPTMAQTLGNATNLAAVNAVSQPLDADLTSWALITRASGFDTFTATPSSANLRSLVTDETGTSGGLVFAGSPTLITPVLGAATGTSLTLSSLTSGRVTYATTSGLLTDSASLLFDGSKAQIGTTSATRLLLGTATDSSNGALQLATHTTSAGGIGFGTDVTLYRSASDTLKTDDGFVVGGGAAASTAATTVQLTTFGSAPRVNFINSAGPVNGKYFDWYFDSSGANGRLSLRAIDDASSVVTNLLQVTGVQGATTGTVSVLGTTASTSTTTGALTVAGGLGVAGAQFLGGNLTFGTSASVLNGTTGSIGLTATGTNQGISITPSGSGFINLGNAATPVSRVQVTDNYRDTSSGLSSFSISSTDSFAIDKGGSMQFAGSYTGTTQVGFAAIKGAKENVTDNNTAGYLAFSTRVAGGALGERGRFTSTGNFLVGTTTDISGSGGISLSGNITAGGAFIGGVQSLSGAGAVNVTTLTTEYTSTGAAQALSLADGSPGQIKIIIHGVDGGSGVLTPTTKTGYTTITFTAVGESAMLQFVATRGWIIISLRGAVAA